MTKQACENCRFWIMGTCHSRPPVGLETDNGGGRYLYGFWPFTQSNDWCGQWEAETTDQMKEHEFNASALAGGPPAPQPPEYA